jgi:hypothetical protein
LVPSLQIGAILAVYTAALFYARDRIPYGLNNDAAEEALRGLYLIAQGRFEPITLILGNSAETLYLYLEAAVSLLFGPSTLAIQAVSWVFALGCLALTARVTQRLVAGTPAWIPLLVGGSSLWLFHFARSGLRTITAPLFLIAFVLALDLAERNRKAVGRALFCGAILGLSLYGYTSARAIVIAFACYAGVRLWLEKDDRRSALRCYGLIAAGLLVVSIPNLMALIDAPDDFLLRGSYVAPGSLRDIAINIGWSAVFPVYFPAKFYAVWGSRVYMDGVSLGFLAAGFRPVSFALFLLAAFGWWLSRGSRAAMIMAATWVAVILTVGIGGPSPTRLLILFPVVVAFASAGLSWILRSIPKLSVVAAVGLVALAAFDFTQYMRRAAPLSQAYGGRATVIGQAARQAAAAGKNVLCVVQSDANVVRYMTYGYEKQVTLVEFYRRPAVASEIPLMANDTLLLIEDSPRFRELITSLRERDAEVMLPRGPD